MIGNSETNGFAYSLRDFGATDFDFEKIGDKIYFVIKINLTNFTISFQNEYARK